MSRAPQLSAAGAATLTKRPGALLWLAVTLIVASCQQSETPVHASQSALTGGVTTPAESNNAQLPTGRALPTVIIENSQGTRVPISVEVARTPRERQRGLMFRKSLDANGGMWFDMGRIGNHSFWMKNTYIALDLLFVGPEGVIMGIVENATPETLTSRRIDRPSRYVLEVNAHFARKHHISAGDHVNFAEVVKH